MLGEVGCASSEGALDSPGRGANSIRRINVVVSLYKVVVVLPRILAAGQCGGVCEEQD
jgi:hypothetical protein